MKPKNQRLHYAHKHLRSVEPERYCRRNTTRFVHEPLPGTTDVIQLHDVVATNFSLTYTATCEYCLTRIQANLSLLSGNDDWSDLEWRSDQYVIAEEPW